MSEVLTLHHVPQSRSMRVLWLLHELAGVNFSIRTYPFDKSLRSEAFLALSPAGRVPALEIDGARMFESGAMIEYLCERFPQAGLGRLAGEPERQSWLTWLHFAETLSVHAAALTQQHIMLYEDHMRSPHIMQLEAKRLAKCYGAIEARLRESGAYLLESGFSAVDIAVGQAVYLGQHFAQLDPYPVLGTWYERITAREGFRKSLPEEGETRLYAKAYYEPWPLPEAN